MIEVKDVVKTFDGFRALDGVTMTVPRGAVYGLVGPNGAGKSTLIRAILGQREYEGKITFHEASGKEAKLRIGYVPQSPAFDRGDPVSVMDLFTCCIFKRPAFLRPTKAMREKVLACLANVHGEALIDKRIGTLSGGELQRFCIARALATRPRYLICDEVSTMLDAVTQAHIWHVLLDYAAHENAGMLLVSHTPALTARIAIREVALA